MASELGRAYVQIVPSAKGISGKISQELGDGSSAGSKFGAGLVGGIKKVIAVAGIGATIAKAFTEYANLEQSLGGIEAIFVANAQRVIKNSEKAYRQAGMSQNSYLETVASFSATLINDLGGDTEKAADIANKAAISMSDNWNRFGGDFGLIQNAYQGFAKQNYTMLDNLKLGYGGTKAEMERLIQDANEYGKSIGLAGDLSIDSFADQVEAIDLIQQKYGVAGTTAKEATTTISGSFNMLKASISDALGQLIQGDNIKGAMQGVVDSVIALTTNVGKAALNLVKNIPTAVTSLLQAVGNAITSNAGNLAAGASTLMAQFYATLYNYIPKALDYATNLVNNLSNYIQQNAPTFLQNAVTFVSEMGTAFINSLPTIIEKAGNLINAIIDFIGQNAPMLFEAAGQLFGNLAKALIPKIPEILGALGRALISIGGKIQSYAPTLLKTAVTVVGQIAGGILSELAQLAVNVGKAALKVGGDFLKNIGKNAGKLVKAGLDFLVNLIKGIVQGIGNLPQTVNNLWQTFSKSVTGLAKGAVGNGLEIVLNLVKGLLSGIGSIVGAVGTLVSSALTKFTSGNWLGSATAAIGKVVSGITSAAGSVLSAMGNIVSGAIGKITNGKWGETAKQAIGKVKDGIASTAESVKNAVGGMADKAINFFKGKGWQASGTQSGQKINTGINSQAEGSKKAGGNLGNKAVTGFSAYNASGGSAGATLSDRVRGGIESLIHRIHRAGGAAGQNAISGVRSGSAGAGGVGSSITDGVAGGIQNSGAIARLVNSARSMAASALNAAKSFLDINSPSKLFRDVIGQSIPEGVAVGIDKYTYFATDAVKRMSQDMLAEAEKGAGYIDGLTATGASLGATRRTDKTDQVIGLLTQIAGKDTSLYLDGEKVSEELTPYINRKLGEAF